MKSLGQDLFDITFNILSGLKVVLTAEKPDLVLVHGDTTVHGETTNLSSSRAAYFAGKPVGNHHELPDTPRMMAVVPMLAFVNKWLALRHARSPHTGQWRTFESSAFKVVPNRRLEHSDAP